MIPARVNPLTRNDVDAQLLFVINMNALNYLLSEKISFPCKKGHLVKLKKGHLHKISHVYELLLGVSFLFGQYIGPVVAHRALNKQHGYSSKYLS